MGDGWPSSETVAEAAMADVETHPHQQSVFVHGKRRFEIPDLPLGGDRHKAEPDSYDDRYDRQHRDNAQ